jgi:hypothetical protein
MRCGGKVATLGRYQSAYEKHLKPGWKRHLGRAEHKLDNIEMYL